MAGKEARELTEGTAKTLRKASIAFAAVMTIVGMYFVVRYAYPFAIEFELSEISVTANFIKLLGYWGWKLTGIGPLDFLIGVIHVLTCIALVLAGIVIDLLATVIPLTIGLFLGLFLLLITWGSDKAFAVGVFTPMVLTHIAVIFGISSLFSRLILRVSTAVFGFSVRSLEYSIGFLGYKFYMERLLKRRAVDDNIAGASSEEEVGEDMSSKLVESLNKQEAENLKKLAEYQVLYPEISNEEGVAKEIQSVLGSSVLGNEYGGYIAEATKRFAMRQINKTMDSQVETLKKVRAIIEELTAIQKAKIALSESVYEGEMAKIRNEIRGEQLKSGQLKERIIKEEAIKDKILELEEAEVEAKIQEAKSKKEKLIVETELAKKDLHSSGRGLSAAERNIQSTKDKIEMIKAKSLGLDMIRKAMEEDLTGVSDEKVKKEKERLWAAYIMEKREE